MATSSPRKRVRTIPNPKGSVRFGKWQFLQGSVWKDGFNVDFAPSDPFLSTEITQDHLNSGPPYTSGGPFTNVKAVLEPVQMQGTGVYQTPTTFNQAGITAFWRYVGGFGNPDFTGIGFTNSQYADRNFLFSDPQVVPSMVPWYSQVDKTLRPRLAKANLAQFAYELREAPRMLRTTAQNFRDLWSSVGGNLRNPLMTPRGAADAFLNDQFGWQPFVRDIREACKAALFAKEFILELQRMNNTWTKRRGVISETESDSILAQGLSMKVKPSGFNIDQLVTSDGGWTYRHTYRKHTTSRVWATGEYKFYRPEFDTSLLSHSSPVAEVQRYLTLFGARISPSVIWRVTPWTWLIDWFASVGSLIDSLEANLLDGVVSKNLYLMQRTEQKCSLQQEINFISGAKTLTFERSLVSKQRAVAGTPYGFGLTSAQLSARQWAILGALGLTRAF